MTPYSAPGITSNIDGILRAVPVVVCKTYGLEVKTLYNQPRIARRDYVEARYIIIFLNLTLTACSLKEAGLIFRKDHATAIHAKKTVLGLLAVDKIFRSVFTSICRESGMTAEMIEKLTK